MITKEMIHNTINTMPDNFTVDQVIEEIILIDKIEQGIKDANEGRVYTTEQVKEKLNKWLK
jgi:predicted transcriptional regulator